MHWQYVRAKIVGRCHSMASDKSMSHINTKVVLVAVVSGAIILNPDYI